MTALSLDDKLDMTFKRIYGKQAQDYLNANRRSVLKYDHDAIEKLSPDDYARRFWEEMYESAKDQDDFIDQLVKHVYTQPVYRGSYAPGMHDSFETDARDFEVNYRPALDEYMESQGRQAYELDGITRGYLEPGAIAGLAMDADSRKSVIIGNTNYEFLRDNLADAYRMPKEWAAVYTQAHEHMHRWQYGMDLSEMDAERDVESMLSSYFNHMAEIDPGNARMYDALAGLARDRMFNVERNYSAQSTPASAAPKLPYSAG